MVVPRFIEVVGRKLAKDRMDGVVTDCSRDAVLALAGWPLERVVLTEVAVIYIVRSAGK